MQAAVQEILDQARGAWRYRWLALAVAWAICLAGWAIVFIVPDTFQASARIFVDTDTALSEVTRGLSIESDVDTEIQRVRQAMLGAPQLQRVVEETDLAVGAITPRDRQLAIEDLLSRIDISYDVTSNRAGVYVISYANRSRTKSIEVVEALLNSFVEGTLGGKREGSQQAQQFLVNQIAEYERRLVAAEQRLADFKKENVGLMPGAQGDYFARLQAEMESLNRAQTAYRVAAQRRDQLGRQLRGEEASMASPASGGATSPAAAGASSGDTAGRIQDARLRLDELLLRFTDKHPDVIALRKTLRELESRQEEETAAIRRGDPGAAARSGLSTNPVFQSIQLQFNQAEVEIAENRAKIADHQRRMAELRSLVNTAPEVEAELSRLNRDYEVSKTQYQALVQRLEAARLGEEAEATGMVRFEVIDPPRAGFDPVSPNRPLMIIAVLVLALGAGGSLAYLLQMLKPVFSTARQLSAATGLPVLGEICMARLDKFKVRRRRDDLAFVGATLALVAVAAGVFAGQSLIITVVRGVGA